MTVAAASSTASQVYPGLVGFLVVAGMGLALYFLFRSLNKQLRKIEPGGTGRPGPRTRAPRPGLQAHRAAASARQGGGGAGDRGEPDGGAVSGPEAPAGR